MSAIEINVTDAVVIGGIDVVEIQRQVGRSIRTTKSHFDLNIAATRVLVLK
jgi:hypothetical protein